MVDLTTREELGEPLRHENEGMGTVVIGELDDRPIAITECGDVRVWDLTTHKQLGTPLTDPHGKTVGALDVAIGRLDDRPVAITADSDGTARIWSLSDPPAPS